MKFSFGEQPDQIPPVNLTLHPQSDGSIDIRANTSILLTLSANGTMYRYLLSDEDKRMGFEADDDGRIYLEDKTYA